jgi:lipoprotein signal peptidase
MHEGNMTCCSQRPYLWLFGILALVGLAADQASKYVVFARLYPGDTERESVQHVIPDLFALRTIYSHESDSASGILHTLRTISGERLPEVNRGALFGIGNQTDMNTFFAIVSVLAACFIVFWTSRPSVATDRFLCVALGLILGGTLGNLYDRVVFGGVRDFLHCYYEGHIWPDFNVADCCLVCGAGVLLVHSFFARDPASAPAHPEPVAAAAPAHPEAITAQAPLQTTSPTSTV